MSRLNSARKFDRRILIGVAGPKAAPVLVSLSARSLPAMPTWEGQKAKEIVEEGGMVER